MPEAAARLGRSVPARSLPAWLGTTRAEMRLPAGPLLKAEVSRRPEGV